MKSKLSILLILFSSLCLGQTWNKEFGTLAVGWFDISTDIECQNDSIYLVYADANPTGGTRVNFCNISFEGDVNWLKTIQADSTIRNGGDSNSTDYSSNLNRFVLAHQYVISLEYDSNDPTFFGGVMVLDQDFDSLYTRTIGDSLHYYICNQARFTADNGFLAVGSSDAENNGAETQTLLVKYNSAGEQEWQTFHGFPGYVHTAYSVVEFPNGNIVTGGGFTLNSDIIQNPILTLFDENGNYLDDLTFGNNDYSGGWAKINPLSDGNLIMCASKQENDVEDLFYLVKVDSSLNIIWEQAHDLGSSATAFRQIKENEDGSFIGVGIWVDPLTGYEYGVILKFDSLGNLLWQRKYQHADTGWAQLNILYDVAEIPDNGGYVACGQRNELDTGQNAWVIKVDDMGCLVEGCDTISSVAELTNLSSFEFSVGPNPAVDYLNVFLPELPQEMRSGHLELQLSTIDGKKVFQQKITNPDVTYILPVSDYPRGTYALNVVYEGELISTKKVILN